MKRSFSNPKIITPQKPQMDSEILENARRRKNQKLYAKYINECAKRKNFELARNLYNQFLQQGLQPDVYTFTAMLNACQKNGRDTARYLQEMEARKISPNDVVYCIQIEEFCKKGNFEKAFALLQQIKELCTRKIFQAMVRHCVAQGNLEVAQQVVATMKQGGVEFSIGLCENMITLNLQHSNFKEAQEYYFLIKNLNQEPANQDRLSTSRAYVDLMIASTLIGETEFTQTLLKDTSICQSIAPQLLQEIQRIVAQQLLGAKKEKKKSKASVLEFYECESVSFVKQTPKVKFNDFTDASAKRHLDICSGSGEWVVEKCRLNQHMRYVCVEHRVDRVFSTYLLMRLYQLDNLEVVCGDVELFLSHCDKDYFDCITLLFPEPITDADNKLSLHMGAHLGQLLFDSLKPLGKFILLSDDVEYGKWVYANFDTVLFSKLALETKATDPLMTEYVSTFSSVWDNRERNDRILVNFTKS